MVLIDDDIKHPLKYFCLRSYNLKLKSQWIFFYIARRRTYTEPTQTEVYHLHGSMLLVY